MHRDELVLRVAARCSSGAAVVQLGANDGAFAATLASLEGVTSVMVTPLFVEYIFSVRETKVCDLWVWDFQNLKTVWNGLHFAKR